MLDIKAVEEKLETVQEILDGLKEEIGFIKQKKSEQKEDLSKLCTIDEKIILKNLNNNKPLVDWWIARDRRGLYLYESEPLFSTEGNEFYEEDNNYYGFNMYRNLFQFIKNNGCYRVSDLIADLEEEIDL